MTNIAVGKWISLLYRYGHIYITKELEPYEIGKGQFLFLLTLYHEDGLLQEELASYLNINKSTTARALCKLEKAGYVIRKPKEQDLRSNQIFLTQQAKDFKPTLFSILDRWNNVLCTSMTQEEIEMAFSLLTRMTHNATDYINTVKSRIACKSNNHCNTMEGAKHNGKTK